MSAKALARIAVAALLTGSAVATSSPSGAEAGAPLATSVAATAESAIGTFHPYSTLVLPDVIFGQAGLSHAEIQSSPFAVGIAGPFYAPAAGLLGLIGLPSAPPGTLPYCASYFPGDPPSASCVGPRQDNGGMSFALSNGQTESKGDFTDLSKLFSVASVRFGGADGNGFTAGGGHSTAETKPQDGRWTAGASLEIEHLSIANVLTIDSIASSATGALNGQPGTGAASRRFTVTGAKVGDQPVEITSDGVVVAGKPGGGEQGHMLQEQLSAQLKAANVDVRLIPGSPPDVSADGTADIADTGGVAVSFAAPAPAPAGNGFEVVFGRSFVRMSAYNPDLSAPALSLSDTAPAAGTSSSVGSEPSSSSSSSSGETLAFGGGGSLTDQAQAAPSAAAEPFPGGSSGERPVAAGSDVVPAGAAPPSGVDSIGNPPVAPPAGEALPVSPASTSPQDTDDGGVRRAFVLIALVVLAGPLLILGRRIRPFFGG
jgi:hypothetical protein